MSHSCETCDRWFGSWDAARQHMDALDHWDEEDEFGCDRCDRTFSTENACNQHMSALGHWYTETCDTCERRFIDKHAAEQHMDALDHWSLPYCTSCDRYFQKLSDLYQHMNSPIHLRADPIHVTPAPPVRPASVSRPTPVNTSASPATVFSSTLPITNPYRAPRLDPDVITAPARPIAAIPPVTATPAAITTQPVSGRLSSSPLAKPCTTCIPFDTFIEMDNSSSAMSHYQSITFMRSHQAFSFEELRLADYRAGCRPANGSVQVVVWPIYRDQATQADIPRPPPSSVYVSAISSRATTPVDPAQEHSTALTAEEVAGFHLIYEARCDARKLLMDDDNKHGWIKHGAGLIRILQCKTTALLHILMLADKSGKIGMNFNVPLDATLYTVRKARIV